MKFKRASWLSLSYALVAQGVLLQAAAAQADKHEKLDLRMSLQIDVPISESNAPLFLNQTPFAGVSRPCTTDAVETMQALHLTDVLERILCRSPRMQQALASVAEQHAGVILAEQAQRPRFSANADFNIAQAPATTQLAATRARSAGAGIALNWVLFDFGASNAGLRSARSQLASAFASQSSAQLAQISDALRLYAEALRNHARLASLRDAEAAAQLSVEIASGRYAAQVGSLAEKLQAQSALAQAQLDLARAQGQWRSSQGSLAVAMGLPVSTPVSLASVEQVLMRFHAAQFSDAPSALAFDSLLASVLAQHPRLQAARAEIEALQARLDQTKAQDRGTVSINSGVALNQGLGGTSGREADRNMGVGVQASIPIFDSRSQNARQAQSSAQISSRQAQLSAIERELQIELWQAVQRLFAEIQNLKASESLINTAKQGQEVALGRYQAGIGSMLELLVAQNSFNQAKLQRADAAIALLQSHLQLALFSGRLDGNFKK